MLSAKFLESEVATSDIEAMKKQLIYRHIAWLNALRIQLRKQNDWQEAIGDFVDQAEFDQLMRNKNKATQLIQKQGEFLQTLRGLGVIEDFRHMQIDNTLSEFYNLQGKAERIKNTPLARSTTTYSSNATT